MKRDKILYWISTAVVAGMMLFSAALYLTQSADLMTGFKTLGLPVYIVMILGTAKLFGGLALLLPVPSKIKEWAYAGFTFVFIGAIWTHLATQTPFVAPLIFLVVLALSYWFWQKTGASSSLAAREQQASRLQNQNKQVAAN